MALVCTRNTPSVSSAAPLKSYLHLSSSIPGSGCELCVIAEAPEHADEPVGGLTDRGGIGPQSAFPVADAFMQDLPCDATEAVSDGPDRFEMPQLSDQTAVSHLEYAAFGLDRRVGRLGEHMPEIPVALG